MENSAVYTEDGKRVSTKFLGMVFLYMFIGLAITALTSFCFAYFLTANFRATNGTDVLNEQGMNILIFTVIASFIIALIDSFTMPFLSSRTGKAPWIGYIVYALCMGLSLSVILLVGIPFDLIGEAFGITALVFLVMALIGGFSKVDLSPLAFIGIALAIGLLMVSLFWGIYMAVAGYQTYYLYYYLGSMGLIVVMMLFVAFDVNRMVAIAQKGMATTNTALYCAFQLYGDFIVLFIRILYLLLATQSRK
jgi:uncharacterized protein